MCPFLLLFCYFFSRDVNVNSFLLPYEGQLYNIQDYLCVCFVGFGAG